MEKMTDWEMDALIAERVMGWRQVKFPALVTEAVDDGIVRFIVNGSGQVETRRRRGGVWGNWEYFHPITDPADSKMVREKLAERFDYIRVEWARAFGIHNCIAQQVGRTPPNLTVQAEADTEERAVALCALKTVGVTP